MAKFSRALIASALTAFLWQSAAAAPIPQVDRAVLSIRADLGNCSTGTNAMASGISKALSAVGEMNSTDDTIASNIATLKGMLSQAAQASNAIASACGTNANSTSTGSAAGKMHKKKKSGKKFGHSSSSSAANSTTAATVTSTADATATDSAIASQTSLASDTSDASATATATDGADASTATDAASSTATVASGTVSAQRRRRQLHRRSCQLC